MAAEGFKVMTYHCDLCGKEIPIWNSRDGVTPYTIQCRDENCGGMMSHVRWEEDEFDPLHIPQKGEWLFITMPKSLRLPAARHQVARLDGTSYEVEGEAKRENLAQGIANDYEPDMPMLIQWPY